VFAVIDANFEFSLHNLEITAHFITTNSLKQGYLSVNEQKKCRFKPAIFR